MDKRTEQMPCPWCGFSQSPKKYPDEKTEPCAQCGVRLRVSVPLHAMCALPYGWKWERAALPLELAQERVWALMFEFLSEDQEEMRTRIGREIFLALDGIPDTEVSAFFQRLQRAVHDHSDVARMQRDYSTHRKARHA